MIMKEIANPVVKMEMAYMVAKLVNASKKGKDSICHYSSLYRATLNTLLQKGVEMDGLGKHNYRLHVPSEETLKSLVAEFEVDNDYTINEFNYVIEKIRLAKEKETICHYSYLQTPTLKKLATMGIKYDALGKHGYRFYYPEKKTKAWYRLINYGKVKRNADGSFCKKTA